MFLKMLIMFICFNLDFCVSYANNHFKRILKHSNTIQSFFFFFKSWCKVVCYTTWASHISQVQNFQQRGNNFQYIIFKFPFLFFFLSILIYKTFPSSLWNGFFFNKYFQLLNCINKNVFLHETQGSFNMHK